MDYMRIDERVASADPIVNCPELNLFVFLGVIDMNLVDLIKDQLSSGVIKHLSSQIDASEGATRSAAFAAVPALLSALSGLASGGSSGSQKLVSALESLGSGSIESLTHKMTNQPGAVLEQGASILSSLFGSSTISGVVNVLSRFASLAPGATQKLLGYLTPLVLGSIASHFSGKSINGQSLANLFADQKANIASAMPSGFSLTDVPGLAAAGSAVRPAARGVEEKSSSMMRWLLPLAGIAAVAALLWMFLPSRSNPAPEVKNPIATRAQSPDNDNAQGGESIKLVVPDVSKLKTELTDTFSSLTEALTSIKDVKSAETALPKLQELEGKLEVAKTTMKDLGTAAKATITTLVKASEGKVRELIEKVLAIPGVGEKIKAVADSIKTKLTDLSA
jgi:hypothetical protein